MPYPSEYKGRDIHSLEGHSFASVFSNLDAERGAVLCWEHEGNAAARDGRWKLVRNFWRNSELPMEQLAAWELYDMSTDRTEEKDLSRDMPERARSLLDTYLAWAKRCNVLDVHTLRECGSQA